MKPSSREDQGTSAPPALNISSTFCDANADITFKSSDDVLFKIYSKYLAATSGGLQVPSEFLTTPKEIIPLGEPSEILDLLFQFIHPRMESSHFRQPSVMNMDPTIFFALAEAAEKYQVFGAMNTCITRCYQLIKKHPLEILNHAYRHGYADLADLVGIETIGKPLDEIAKRLTHPGLLQRWVLYYIPWRNVATAGITKFQQTSNNPSHCKVWSAVQANYLAAVMGNSWDHNYTLGRGQQPCNAKTGGGHPCTCSGNVQVVQNQLSLGISGIPKFSEIVI